MAEIKSNPVIYNCDSEGRDAFWSALRNSLNRKSIALTKRSRPEQVFCDSSQYEYQCSDVENKHSYNSEVPLTVSPLQTPVTPDKTADDQSTTFSTATPTTPSPPPPLQSPPPLEHRSAGQRRRSSALSDDWPAEWNAGARATRSAVYRLRSRRSVSAITWLDDLATAAAADDDKRPCNNCNNVNTDDGGTDAAKSVPAATVERSATAEDEKEEEEDKEKGRGAGADEDGDLSQGSAGWPVVAVAVDDEDVRTGIIPLQQPGSPAQQTVIVDDVDDDDPTLVYDDDRDQRHYDDNLADVNQLYIDVVGDSLVAVSDHKQLSEYEMKVKEIDENIAFYTKRFMCTIMFFVLLRVFY